MHPRRSIYRSTAVGEYTAVDFDRIVAVSERNNRRRGITGAVTLCEGRFVQVLEGSSKRLDALMVTLVGDARHRDLCVLGRWTVTGRLFPYWSMAEIDSANADAKIRDWLKVDNLGVTLVGALLSLTGNVPL